MFIEFKKYLTNIEYDRLRTVCKYTSILRSSGQYIAEHIYLVLLDVYEKIKTKKYDEKLITLQTKTDLLVYRIVNVSRKYYENLNIVRNFITVQHPTVQLLIRLNNRKIFSGMVYQDDQKYLFVGTNKLLPKNIYYFGFNEPITSWIKVHSKKIYKTKVTKYKILYDGILQQYKTIYTVSRKR